MCSLFTVHCSVKSSSCENRFVLFQIFAPVQNIKNSIQHKVDLFYTDGLQTPNKCKQNYIENLVLNQNINENHKNTLLKRNAKKKQKQTKSTMKIASSYNFSYSPLMLFYSRATNQII